MNFATFFILALIVAAAVAAIRYSMKHGSCEACGMNPGNGSCSGRDCNGCAMQPIEAEQERRYMEAWKKKFPDQVTK
jgi:hypothetical protein